MSNFAIKPTDPMEAEVILEKTARGDVLRRSLGMPVLLYIATQVYKGDAYTAFNIAETMIAEYNKRVSELEKSKGIEPRCIFSGE